MNYKEIQELIRLVKRNKISELEIEKKDFKISIRAQSPGSESATIIQQPIVAAQPQPTIAQTVPVATPTEIAAPEQQAKAEEAVNPNWIEIKSPMIGTFYRAAGPDKAPYVAIGDTVQKGQTICMIEAMKLFNEIEAEQAGKIVKILVEDATPVEFDQPLFLIDPTA